MNHRFFLAPVRRRVAPRSWARYTTLRFRWHELSQSLTQLPMKLQSVASMEGYLPGNRSNQAPLARSESLEVLDNDPYTHGCVAMI